MDYPPLTSAGVRRSEKPAGAGWGWAMLRVSETVEVVDGFGCRYRVTVRTWRLFGMPLWAIRRTERS